jgi:hypothetical protein
MKDTKTTDTPNNRTVEIKADTSGDYQRKVAELFCAPISETKLRPSSNGGT